jgi:uncharacterized membrane protein YeaQ/YmgE (transglycosylase-associated protein family)
MMGVTVGSIIGGYVPVLWGGSLLSFSSVIFGTIGAIVGLFVAYRLMD